VQSPVPAVADYLNQIREQINYAVAVAKDNRLTAKTLQVKHANRSRREEPVYNVGDKVMLDTRNIRKRLKKKGRSAKFYPRYLGPFQIIEVRRETSNYKLDLPAEYRIHPMFHARLLKPFAENDANQFPLREPPRPPPVVPEDDRYEVEEILDHRQRKRGRRTVMEYLVRWAGYGQEDDQWVAENDIDDGIVQEYQAKLEAKTGL